MGLIEDHKGHKVRTAGCPICAARKEMPGDPDVVIPAGADLAAGIAEAAKVAARKVRKDRVRITHSTDPDFSAALVADDGTVTPIQTGTIETTIVEPAPDLGDPEQSGPCPETKKRGAVAWGCVFLADHAGNHQDKKGREWATKPLHETREAWMLAAVALMRPWFAETTGDVIPPVRISVGWPGGRGSKRGVLGQCWAPEAVDDKVPAIFVTPSQREAVEVLETIAHECIHACGHFHHRAPFQKIALKLGFENGGKCKTKREESPALYHRLDKWAEALGPFPHAAVTGGDLYGGGAGKPKVQSTRMLKVSCEADGYTLRATAKWLQQAVPTCPLCDGDMEVEWK